jgi:competence protein ComEC
MGWRGLQTGVGARIEAFFDIERDQIALWLPVSLGVGIAAWFALPNQAAWIGWMVAMAGIACAALILPVGGCGG